MTRQYWHGGMAGYSLNGLLMGYQNGGAERHIQSMVQRVTLMYAEAPHVPRELHSYALQLYVDIFRTWTLNAEKPSIGEAFTGKRVDYISRPLFRWGNHCSCSDRNLIVIGSLAYIRSSLCMWGCRCSTYRRVCWCLILLPDILYSLVCIVLPDEWGVVTRPLPGFIPGDA